jgi:hypothetical protein
VRNTDHVVFDTNTQSFRCQRCGVEDRVNLPAPIDEVVRLSRAFEREHARCPSAAKAVAAVCALGAEVRDGAFSCPGCTTVVECLRNATAAVDAKTPEMKADSSRAADTAPADIAEARRLRAERVATAEEFGGCPTCGLSDGYANNGREHWFYCRAHGVRWFAGENLFSGWRDETDDERVTARRMLAPLRVVEPMYRPRTEGERP